MPDEIERIDDQIDQYRIISENIGGEWKAWRDAIGSEDRRISIHCIEEALKLLKEAAEKLPPHNHFCRPIYNAMEGLRDFINGIER